MKRNLLLILLIGIGAAFVARRALARSQESGFYNPDDDLQVANHPPNYFFVPDDVQELPNVLGVNMGAEQNILAFLALIRKFETNDKYNVVYGGATFSDFSDHPNRRVPINLPGYEGKYSSAAGAYQFLWRTWDNLRNRLQLPDFSPASQDAAAIELLREIGALPAIEAGDFDTALRYASKQWASLPYSTAGQNEKSIVAANEFLRRYLA